MTGMHANVAKIQGNRLPIHDTLHREVRPDEVYGTWKRSL